MEELITQSSIKNDKKNKKIGIAFSGGGAKGYVHIGVVKALQEYGLKFDCIAGTSAGSIVGAFYANGYSWEQMFNIGKKLKTADIKKYKILPSKTDGIQKLLINAFGDINIEDLKTPFTAVAVDIKTLKECAITSGNLAKAVAGSCCVPGAFEPVKFEDKLLCDGGLKNSIPADVLKEQGCDYVISVDIGGEKKGVKSSKLFDVLTCALDILVTDTKYRGYLYSDMVIQPTTHNFLPTKIENCMAMVEEGYRATIEVMPQILEFFSERKTTAAVNKQLAKKRYKAKQYIYDIKSTKVKQVEKKEEDKVKQDKIKELEIVK